MSPQKSGPSGDSMQRVSKPAEVRALDLVHTVETSRIILFRLIQMSLKPMDGLIVSNQLKITDLVQSFGLF